MSSLKTPISSQLDRIRKLDHGSYGSVYLFQRRESQEKLAVKIVQLEKYKLSKLSIFQKEVSLLSLCRSPYIVSYFGSFLQDSSLFITMEYIEYGSTHHLLHSIPGDDGLPDSICALILHDSLGGLAYLNSCGLMHLDIKPKNLLVTSDGHCKLCDFGVARSVLEGIDEAAPSPGLLAHLDRLNSF